MSKIYVVMENNWEYNDEYHSEQEGGNPQQAFPTRPEAEAEVKLGNRAQFRKLFSKASYNESPSSWVEDGGDPYDLGKKLWRIFHSPEQEAKDFVQSLSARALNLDDEHAEEFLKIQALALTDPLAARDAMEAFLKGIGDDPEETDYESYYWNFLLPPEATDEQVDAVMAVFDWITFYYVAEIPFNG